MEAGAAGGQGAGIALYRMHRVRSCQARQMLDAWMTVPCLIGRLAIARTPAPDIFGSSFRAPW